MSRDDNQDKKPVSKQALPRFWAFSGLALLVIALFISAPISGEFYWSDSPRHALNGVFVKDFLTAMPWKDPTGFAYQYYIQYPALTILFYPPLFYFISAPFYGLFGVSHATAVFVVLLHYIAFAWGAWQLFRFWMPDWQAVAAAVILVCAPETAFWGRQVMLEIPAFALLVWGAVYFTHYRRSQRSMFLYAAIALLTLAMYTKISVAFMVPVWAAILVIERKLAIFRDKYVWLAVALGVVALVPLLVLTMKFGQANMQSVSGIPDAQVDRNSIAGWLWYIRQMPGQLGWPVCAAALAGLALTALDRNRAATRLPTKANADSWFWIFWAVFGYLFFSAIALKEARHSLFILPPVVLAASLLPAYLSGQGFRRAAAALWIALPVGVLVETVFFRPVLYVEGYAAAADYIAQHAPQGSNVLFSGYRDGSFIFNMRCREDRRDIGIIRADKILLNIAVRREIGVTENNLSESQLSDKINSLAIHYIVAQPGFWTDLEAMRRFERLLASNQFEKVAEFETPANFNASEKRLFIYRNLGKVSNHKGDIEISLPIIDKIIHSRKKKE